MALDQATAETLVTAALQTLVGQGFTDAKLSASFAISGTVPGQPWRKHSVAVSGSMDSRGDIVTTGKASNPVNQPGAPATTAGPRKTLAQQPSPAPA